MLNHPAAKELLKIIKDSEYAESQRQHAAELALDSVQFVTPEAIDPDSREPLERTAARVVGLALRPECTLAWAKRFAGDVQDAAARQLLERFVALVDECMDQLKIGPRDRVLASKVLTAAASFSWFHVKEPSPSAVQPEPMTRKAMIAEYLGQWPSVERDIQDAAENGLSKGAKAGVRKWNGVLAVKWAEANGKIIRASEGKARLTAGINVMSALPSRKHELKG